MEGSWGKHPLTRSAPTHLPGTPTPCTSFYQSCLAQVWHIPCCRHVKGCECQDRVCGTTWAGMFLLSAPQVSSAEHMDMTEEGEGSHGHRSHPSS